MAISKRLSIWASTILILAPLAAAQSYSVTDLGTFLGGTVSQGYGINVLGQVAGYARFADFNAHGFFWSQPTGLLDLGSIPPQTNFSVGQAINSFSDVAGYSYYDRSFNQLAVLWSHGTVRDLGTLPGGSYSQANGINDLGEVTGYSNGAGQPHAVLWNKQGVVQDLGALPGGYSQGLGINLQGEVIGFSNAANGNWFGFLWTQSTGMKALPMLPGANTASANGINDLGQIVGGSGYYAVLWHNDRKHTAESLGAVSGQKGSTAFAINDPGQVVGWSGAVAFVWSREHGMQDLNKLIPGNSGWSLTLATAINAQGQITGQGTINGQQHAFLLTPVSH